MRSGRKKSVVLATVVLGAFVWFAGVFVAAALLVAISIGYAARGPIVRRARLHRDERHRRLRREARELRLEQADAASPGLEQLTALAETIERTAPHEARCYCLDDLLDRYVTTAIARDACMRQLVRSPTSIGSRPGELARSVRERATAWRQRCTGDVVHCDERMGEIGELIRLYAERVATPEIAHLFDDDIVGRQLASLPAACA